MPPDKFRAGLDVLGSRYRVVYDEGVFSRSGFLAGSDERRAEELNRYFRDPDVRAILCARGGYGTMRILPLLDAGALSRDPKPVVGFSDLTALLSFCVQDAGIRPIHGPTITQLSELPVEDVAWLFRVLEDPGALGRLPGQLRAFGPQALGAVEGPLYGGNLELVSRLQGTPWALDLRGTVLFIEDVGERPYRIDRGLTQLDLSGALRATRAVLLGDLTRCLEPDGSPPTAEQVFDERMLAFGRSGLAGLPVGHGARNVALPIGCNCVVDFDRSSVTLEESAVG